jgi:diguanylate cyclase
VTELHEGDTPETVFDRADAALYRAKDGGKNLCVAA